MTLDVRHVTTTCPDGVRSLDDVTRRVDRGLFGLLGPNGAGRSSLVRTLATRQRPDTGTVTLDDIDMLAEPARARAHLGSLPQEFGLHLPLSALATLDHSVRLEGVSARGERRDVVAARLQPVNLWDVRDRRVRGFSDGMRQRLGIGIALAGRPRFVIVDEPTAGRDPNERLRFLNPLAAIADDVVVLLSTHIVPGVEALCRHVAIMARGRILAAGAVVRPATVAVTLARDAAPRGRGHATGHVAAAAPVGRAGRIRLLAPCRIARARVTLARRDFDRDRDDDACAVRRVERSP